MDTETHREFPSILEHFIPKKINQHHYYYFKNGFSVEECDRIRDSFGHLCNIDATVFNKNAELSRTMNRKTSIAWIPYNDTTKWIYDRMIMMSREANNEMFRMNISTIVDMIQVGLYDSEADGQYGPHVDIGENMYGCRKLSISVQLSDPSEYTGGELKLKDKINAPKGKGVTCIFPSWMVHEVTPVTSGKRYSLVLWLYGESIR